MPSVTTRLAGQLSRLASTRQSHAVTASRHRDSYLFENGSKLDDETVFEQARSALGDLARVDPRFRPFLEGELFRSGAWQVDIDMKDAFAASATSSTIGDLLNLLSAYFLLPSAHEVFEYLVRHYHVHQRMVDAVLRATLPYHETGQFARILSLIKHFPDQWAFLETAKKNGAAVSRATVVARIRRRPEFLRTVVQIGMSGASLFQTGPSNRAAIAFMAAVIIDVIDKGSVREQNVRILLPFLHDAMSQQDPDLRSCALMVAAVVGPVVSSTARSALLNDVLFGIEAGALTNAITRSLQCAAVLAADPSVSISDSTVQRLKAVSRLPDAVAELSSSHDISSLNALLSPKSAPVNSTQQSGPKSKPGRLRAFIREDNISTATPETYLDRLLLPNVSRGLVLAILQSANICAVVDADVLADTIVRARLIQRFHADETVLAAIASLQQVPTSPSQVAVAIAAGQVATDHVMLSELVCNAKLLLDVVQRFSDLVLPFVSDNVVPLLSDGVVYEFVHLLRDANGLERVISAVIKTSPSRDVQRRVFCLSSQSPAVLLAIMEQQSATPFTFLSSIWTSNQAPVSARRAALRIAADLVRSCASSVDLIVLLPYLLPALRIDDGQARQLAADIVDLLSPATEAPLYCNADEFGPALSQATAGTLRQFAGRLHDARNEIAADGEWVRRMPVSSDTIRVLIGETVYPDEDVMCAVLESLPAGGPIPDDCLPAAVAKLNSVTAPTLVRLLRESTTPAGSAALLDAVSMPDVLRAINERHYNAVDETVRRRFIGALPELLTKAAVPDDLAVVRRLLSSLPISGECAVGVLRQEACLRRKVALLDAWRQPSNITHDADADLCSILFDLVSVDPNDTEYGVPETALAVLTALAEFDRLRVSDPTTLASIIACLQADSRNTRNEALALVASLPKAIVKPWVVPAFAAVTLSTTLHEDDPYAFSVVESALHVLVPIVANDGDSLSIIMQAFVDAWGRIATDYRLSLFIALVRCVDEGSLLGHCLARLLNVQETSEFAHALALKFDGRTQIAALAALIAPDAKQRPSKRRRRQVAHVECSLGVPFVAGHLDSDLFVSCIASDPNTSFADLYTAAFASLSDSFDVRVINIVERVNKLVVLPSFLDTMTSLVADAAVRTRALQSLNDNLLNQPKNVQYDGVSGDVVARLVHVLLGIAGRRTAPEADRQLALTAVEALLSVSDDQAAFGDVLPVCMRIAKEASPGSDLLATSLLTAGATCNSVGARAIAHVPTLMPLLIGHVTGGVDGICEASLTALLAIVSAIPKFTSPYLESLFQAILPVASTFANLIGAILERLVSDVGARLLVPSVMNVIQAQRSAQLIRFLSDVVATMDPSDIKQFNEPVFKLCLWAFADEHLERDGVALLQGLAVKLSEDQFTPLFTSLVEWSGPSAGPRHCTLLAIVNGLLEQLQSLFVPFVNMVVDACAAGMLTKDTALWRRLTPLCIETVRLACVHDDGEFVSKPRFDLIMPALIDQIDAAARELPRSLETSSALTEFVQAGLAPCVGQFASTFAHEVNIVRVERVPPPVADCRSADVLEGAGPESADEDP